MGKENSKLSPKNLSELRRQTSFSDEEIKHWYNSFSQNHPSGKISKEVFKQMYAKIFPNGDASQFAEHVFRTYDSNGDGMVDCREFICGISATTKGGLDQKLKWNFALFDIDGDGFISRQEMLEIVAALYKMAGATQGLPDDELTPEQSVDKMFAKMDKNGDGLVTFEEFSETAKNDSSISHLLQCDTSSRTRRISNQ